MDSIPSKLIPSVSLHLTVECLDVRKDLKARHQKKIEADNVENTAKSGRATLLLEYRGLDSDVLMRKVRAISSKVSVVFLTRKLKSVISNLKGRFPDKLKSRTIYKLNCSSCYACYVGMSSRHLKTRLGEHLKENAPVKQHLVECNVNDFSSSILASCFNLTKLAILEALFIEKLKPSINSKDEQTSRP